MGIDKVVAPSGTWYCNDCKSVNNVCFDHTCEQCGGGEGIE